MTAADDPEVTTAPSRHLPAEIKADSLAGDLHAECPCGWIGAEVKLLSSALIDHAAHAERAAAEARGVERGYRRAAKAVRAEAAERRRLASDALDRQNDGDTEAERHKVRFLAQAVALEQIADRLDQDADSARHSTPQTAPPRLWVLPSIPEDVKALRDAVGFVWHRTPEGAPDAGSWRRSTGAWTWDIAQTMIRNPELGPLTEVPDA